MPAKTFFVECIFIGGAEILEILDFLIIFIFFDIFDFFFYIFAFFDFLVFFGSCGGRAYGGGVECIVQ